MNDLGRFPKSRDVIVFLPSTRDFFAVVAFFTALAVVAITVTELRSMDREIEVAGRV